MCSRFFSHQLQVYFACTSCSILNLHSTCTPVPEVWLLKYHYSDNSTRSRHYWVHSATGSKRHYWVHFIYFSWSFWCILLDEVVPFQHLIIIHTPIVVDYVITGRRVPLKLHVEGVGDSASIWIALPTAAALHLCASLEYKFQVSLDTVDFITEQLELFLQVIKLGISWMWSCNETVQLYTILQSWSAVVL